MDNQQLPESVLQLDESLAESPICSLLLNEQGTILQCNDAASQLLQAAQSDLIGTSVSSKVIGSGAIQALMSRVRKEQVPVQAEFQLALLPPHARHIQLHIWPAHHQRGIFHAQILDVSDYLAGLQRDRVRSQVLSLIAQGAPLAAVLQALVLEFEAANPGSLCTVLLLDETMQHVLTGAAPSMPRHFSEAIHGAPIGPVAGSCGTAAYFNKRVIVTDIYSDPLWVPYRELARSADLASCWSQPFTDSEGKVLGTFAIYHRDVHIPSQQDIDNIIHSAQLAAIATERDRTDERLRKEQMRYRAIVETCEEGIWMTDRNSITNFVNPKLAEMLGFPIEAMLGQHIYQFIPRNLHNVANRFVERRRQGIAEKHDLQLKRQDGSLLWVSISSNPMHDGQGNYTGALAMVVDIDERYHATRLLEERSRELAQANTKLQDVMANLEAKVTERTWELSQALSQAQAAMAAKTDFLAVMTHEVRTPVNGIYGMTQMLEMTQLDEEQHEYLTSIRASSRELLALINDILDLSKIEAGALDLEIQPFDLALQLRSLDQQFRPLFVNKGLIFNLILGELPPILIGDALRLRQVLANLLSNALKFTDRGAVTLRAAAEHCDEQHSRIRFEVEDTGMGIPEDRLHRLFQPFSQVDSSITRHYGGTGLGLSICARLIAAMSGTMTVSSETGKGSCFRFDVLLEQGIAKIPEAQLPLRKPEIDPSIQVLIVEDNLVNQKILSGFLKKAGLTAWVANNGLEAVEIARSHPLDLIFMDLQMPEMDGLTATGLIRELPLAHQPRIIALTANVFETDRKSSLNAGMDHFMIKPFNYSEILDQLELVSTNRHHREQTHDEDP